MFDESGTTYGGLRPLYGVRRANLRGQMLMLGLLTARFVSRGSMKMLNPAFTTMCIAIMIPIVACISHPTRSALREACVLILMSIILMRGSTRSDSRPVGRSILMMQGWEGIGIHKRDDSLPQETCLDGFAHRRSNVLQPGKIVDRYGDSNGGYLGEPGYTVGQRGMPPGSDAKPYASYRVLKEIPVHSGPAAGVPEFGAIGGAPQHYVGATDRTMTIQKLLDGGIWRNYDGTRSLQV